MMTKHAALAAVNFFPSSLPALTSSAARLTARNSFANPGNQLRYTRNTENGAPSTSEYTSKMAPLA